MLILVINSFMNPANKNLAFDDVSFYSCFDKITSQDAFPFSGRQATPGPSHCWFLLFSHRSARNICWSWLFVACLGFCASPKAALFCLTLPLYLCLLCSGFCTQDFYLVLRWVYTEIPPIPQRIAPFLEDLASYTFFIGLVWWRSHGGHAMNIGELRSWFDLFLRATFVFSCDHDAGLPHQGFSCIWPSGPAVGFLAFRKLWLLV